MSRPITHFTDDVLRIANIAPPFDPNKLMRCPLPAHEDKNPSFRLFSQGFRCFGCGRKGGVLDFVVALGFARDRASALKWLELS
jgi:hypothetical protein